MASRNFYIRLIIQVLLLTATALLLGFAAVKLWYVTIFFALILLIGQVYSLITFINSTNRKIAYFFDAIKNEDFTLRFPERVSIKSFKELNTSLNRVNGLIQEVHLQLQIRERYYQEIIKQAKIGIMTYNEQGHILFTNPTLERILNYHPLNHIKQLKQIDEKLYEVFASFRPFERKLFQLTNEREQIQLALKSTALVLDEKPLLLIVVQDIKQELDEKETDSWIRLIRVLTHEIMNTITPITSISESILKYYRTREGKVVEQLDKEKILSASRGLEVIRKQGGDLMDFVQSYRSFLNVPKPDRKIVSAKALLDKVKVLMARGPESTIQLTWRSEPEDLDFFIDEKQLTQILINLVKNAIQSLGSSENGKVAITAAIDTNDRKYIEVKDNGPGIPEHLADEIFVPFFTTKEGGTGIGLSLSRQIMQQHGGTMKMFSIPDAETSFTLTF
ncbi:MAG: ATP-binding protein [Bacteroidota bacterium]